MTSLPKPGRVGEQTPVFDTGPPAVTSAGAECVALAESAGMTPDPWQKYVLKRGLGERPDGKWSALEVACLVSRQNGKGDIIVARQLGGLFLFGSKLSLYSAHEFKTAEEMFLRLRDVIDGTDDLRRRVKKITEGHGNEAVELLNGNRLRFVARSRGSGRGFSGDDIYLDEAFNLSSKMVGAMMPTMSARPNPQIWYFSSAPHLDSEQLKKIQRRGREGNSKGLTYLEWCARNPATALDNRDAWCEANPALGIRITEEFVEAELDAMDAEEFARERLGITEDLTAGAVVDMAVWEELEDRASRFVGPVALAADITPERSSGSIAAVGKREDGLWHAELIDVRAGTGWMVDRLASLVDRHEVCAVVIDDKSPASTLIPDLQEAGLDGVLIRTTAAELATACGMFFDATLMDAETNPTLRHLGQIPLTVALAGAAKRGLGSSGSWAWDRKSPAVDITPLVTVTLALWGRIVHGNKRESDVEPFVMAL